MSLVNEKNICGPRNHRWFIQSVSPPCASCQIIIPSPGALWPPPPLFGQLRCWSHVNGMNEWRSCSAKYECGPGQDTRKYNCPNKILMTGDTSIGPRPPPSECRGSKTRLFNIKYFPAPTAAKKRVSLFIPPDGQSRAARAPAVDNGNVK